MNVIYTTKLYKMTFAGIVKYLYKKTKDTIKKAGNNMKRKILSIILVVMMLFAVAPATNVSAALGGGTGSITINAPANLSLQGQTFTIYQLFQLADVYDPVKNDNYIYKVTPPFENFKYKNMTLLEFLSTTTEIENGFLSAQDEMGLTAALLDYIKNGPSNLTDYSRDITVPATYAGSSYTIGKNNPPGVPLGYYLVAGGGKNAGGDDGHNEVTAICNLTTTDPDAVINLKADAPDIEKDVWNHITEEWLKWTDINMGELAQFKLSSKVPNMQGYKFYYFTVYDKLSGGLTYNPDNSQLTVKVGNATLAQNTDYNVWYSLDSKNYSASVPNTYQPGDVLYIAIDFINFIKYTTGADVIITFYATLNEKAVIGHPGNPNDVCLEYSNNPYVTLNGEPKYDAPDGDDDDDDDKPNRPGRGRTPWKRVIVYTFDIDLYKYFGNFEINKGTPLAGAVFELYTKADYEYNKLTIPPEPARPPLRLIAVDGVPNTYRLPKSGETNTVASVTTPPSGRITIIGLDAGTYYLKEIDCPDGYTMLLHPIKVVITHTQETNGTYIGYYKVEYYTYDPNSTNSDKYDPVGSYTGNPDKNATGSINIENKGGPKFPETGGIGRTIFYITGTILTFGSLIVLAVYLQMSSKKKRENDKLKQSDQIITKLN